MAWEDMTKREREEFRADILMVAIVVAGVVVFLILDWLFGIPRLWRN